MFIVFVYISVQDGVSHSESPHYVLLLLPPVSMNKNLYVCTCFNRRNNKMPRQHMHPAVT